VNGARLGWLLLAAGAGTLVGGYTVWLLSPATVDGASAPAAVVGGMPAASQVAVSRERQPVAGKHAPEAMPAALLPREDASLLSAALLAHAQSEIAGGWREVRSEDVPADVVAQLMERFAAMVRDQPRSLAKRAAEDRKLAELKTSRFAGDDPIALLQVIKGEEPEVKEFVLSKRFGTLLVPRGGGSGVDGTRLRPGEAVGAGSVVSFPAGVFEVSDLGRATGGDGAFPSDVVVRGAGMDATLLMWDHQSSQGPVQRFAIEDCTVFAAGGITDLRSGAPGVLSLRRVRVIGFDCGAGSAVAFYLFGGSVLHASACRFEGGYGRAPQSYANLLDARSVCLARFDQCVFDRMGLDAARGPSFAFVDCSMQELLDTPDSGMSLVNCRITEMEEGKRWDGDYRRRDLNTLFPDWQRRLQRR
jgi:hypothetical protein